MKNLIAMAILAASVSTISAGEISCKLNGKEIELKTVYTCWETEDRIFNSLEEIDQMVEETKAGIEEEYKSNAFRWACRYIDEHASFSINDEKFVIRHSISVNQFRPSDDFIYIQSLSMKSNKHKYSSHTVYSGSPRISDAVSTGEEGVIAIVDCGLK